MQLLQKEENGPTQPRKRAGKLRTSISLRAQIAAELFVIAVFAAAYLSLLQSRPPLLDAAAGLAAVALIALGYPRSRRLWAALPGPTGPYADRMRATFAWVAPFTAAGALLFLGIGLAAGRAEGGWAEAATRVLNWHLVPALAIYLLWGLLQQFVFQFYLLVRLLHLLPARIAVPLTALLFSAVHFPRFIVMAAVAVAGLVWCSLYRRDRALLPLAVSHAILGSTLHYWAFGKDLLVHWLGCCGGGT